MKRQVLHVFPGLSRGGGPAGYAFNLVHALKLVSANETVNVLFPSQSQDVGNFSERTFTKLLKLLRYVPPLILGPLLALRKLIILQNAFRYLGFTRDQVEEIRTSKIVVFHDYRLAITYLRTKANHLKQKVFIMPHTPVDATAEYIENWQEIFGSSWVWPIIYRMLAKIELRTLLKSDGLIVPSRSALEDYFKGIPGRQKLFQLPIYEIKSGVPKLVARRCRDEILPQWGVQPRSKVVGYFGRLHFHKGYDLFCRAAEIAHEEKYENLIFVAAGRGYLPSPHYLPNFRYLGYLTEELADAVAAVDLVVVPNRVSYFDLFILEAMSLGKPVLTSRVGGNLSLDSPGIFFLKELNPKSLLSMILALLSDPRYLEEAGKANQRTYEEQYNLLVFGKRHLEFAQSILSE